VALLICSVAYVVLWQVGVFGPREVPGNTLAGKVAVAVAVGQIVFIYAFTLGQLGISRQRR
jgi:hypothetical protein